MYGSERRLTQIPHARDISRNLIPELNLVRPSVLFMDIANQFLSDGLTCCPIDLLDS